MNIIRLKVQSLMRESFAPFGVLIDSRGAVEVDLGEAQSLTGTTAERRPFAFEFMARHRQTMQVFSPLAGSPCVIAVAPPNESGAPDVESVTAFFVDGRLPFAYHKGTWHTPPFPVAEWASFLVVDRRGTLDDDYELINLRRMCECSFEIEL